MDMTTMYNQDRKQQYIVDVEQKSGGNLAAIMAYFKASKPVEEALNKDISCFTVKEIIGYYKSLSTPSRLYLSTINSQLSMYTSWCQLNDFLIDKQNHFDEITTDMLEACINRSLLEEKYVTRSRLLKIIGENQFVNVSSNFLVLAIFEGIAGREYSEITNLYPEDFDGSEIKLSGLRHFSVSKELKKLAKASASEYTFYQIDDGFSRQRQFDPSDRRCYKNLIKNKSLNREHLLITARLKRLSDLYGYRFLQGKALKESGRIHLIKELMKKNGQSAEECLYANREMLEMRYGRFQSITSYYQKYKDMLERDDE